MTIVGERSKPKRRPIMLAAIVGLIATGGAALAVLALSSEDTDGEALVADFDFQNAAGETIQLSDFRGTAILLNIWATWCVPCREEMPTLDNLQAELGGPDFEVVALSIDVAGRGAVEAFFAEIAIVNLAIYLDPESASWPALAIIGIPTTVLIDREGRELMRVVGPAEWDGAEMMATIHSHLDRQADGAQRIAAPG